MTMNSCFRQSLAALLVVLMSASLSAKPVKQRDLYDTIAANPIMTSFASMLKASDLGTFLSSRGPFTVFVPTDSAFAKLPPTTLDILLQPQNKERLQHIVLFHVVNDKRFTVKDLIPLKAFFSCEGNPLTFHRTHTGAELVSKAKIVHGDIHCANGIIHEIDTVLMPPELALPKLAAPPLIMPTTNGAPAETNVVQVPTAPGDTNAVIPVAPVAKPENSSP